MDNAPQGPGWWQAYNGKWYPPNPHQAPRMVRVTPRPRPQPRQWPWFVAAFGLLCLVAAAVAAFVLLTPPRDSVSSQPVTTPPSTTLAPTTTTAVIPPPTPSFVAPQGPAGCPPPTPQDIVVVNAVLVPMTASGSAGLTLGMASAVQVGDVRHISGDVYDSSGVRLSVVDTWAIVDGVVVATSESAVVLSTAPARLDLAPVPGEPGSELVTCRQAIPPTR